MNRRDLAIELLGAMVRYPDKNPPSGFGVDRREWETDIALVENLIDGAERRAKKLECLRVIRVLRSRTCGQEHCDCEECSVVRFAAASIIRKRRRVKK